jgi:hypothetical protein
VLVPDSNKRLDVLDLSTLKIGGTAVTATADEINTLAGDGGTTGNKRFSNDIPAAAGNSQGTGTAMTADINAVTGADGTKGVVLPTAVDGISISVINTDTTNLLKVYPATGAAINSLSANAAYSLQPGESAVFSATSTTQWYARNNASIKEVAGVGSGYKIARGQATTGSASDTVVTGLATVVSAVAVLEDAPVIGCTSAQAVIGDQAGTPAAGSILIKTWKPTATNDATPTAATTTGKKVNWIAIGT